MAKLRIEFPDKCPRQQVSNWYLQYRVTNCTDSKPHRSRRVNRRRLMRDLRRHLTAMRRKRDRLQAWRLGPNDPLRWLVRNELTPAMVALITKYTARLRPGWADFSIGQFVIEQQAPAGGWEPVKFAVTGVPCEYRAPKDMTRETF